MAAIDYGPKPLDEALDEVASDPAWSEFHSLTRLAAHAFGAESAAIGFTDFDRQLRIIPIGISSEHIVNAESFCRATLAAGETLAISPSKAADCGLRLLAGAPIRNSVGDCIGSLCVFDAGGMGQPCEDKLSILEEYASLAARLIAARRQERLGEIAARLVETSPEAVVATDSSRKIVYWNATAEKMFGHPAAHAMGRDVSIIFPKKADRRHLQRFSEVVEEASARSIGSVVELDACRANGEQFPVELSLARWGEADNVAGFAGVIRDISDRKELERDRQRIGAFLDTVIQNLPAMLFVKDTETRKYVLVNRKAESMVGRSAETMIGHSDSELYPGVGEAYERRDARAAASTEQTVFESEFVRDDGEIRNIRTTRIVIDGPDRPRQFLLGLAEDTTEIRKVENENRRLARFDSMTGLLNRASFFERVQDLVASGRHFAMFSIDLDRFKAVNDQFGHPIGDAVLKEVARRIEELLGEADFAARIGGDEFVVVMTGNELRQRATSFGDTLVERIAEPISVSGRVAHLGVSAGVVVYPADAETIENLRECSDLALYRAKDEGRGKFCFYDSEMDEAAREQRKLEADLRHAIENEEIFLQYQPVICAATGKMTSVEALARWELADRGMIPCNVFIPLAEDCGMIEELGRQILHRTCADARSWPTDLRVAVNLSPLQFRSGKLVGTVREALKSSGMAPSQLQLEVTERLVIEGHSRAFRQLEELRGMGIRILLDDFGVGHSALNYFQRFRFDKIKIDKSFTDEIETSHAAKSIVEAVVGLGRNLSMEVVAEGVETQRQIEMLTALGCSHLQGYVFSKPLEASLVPGFRAGGPAGAAAA